MSQDTNKMSGLVKVAIILVLAVAVGAVVVVKQGEEVEESQTDPVASAVAAEEEKPIPKLLDLGADKCIPCKKMAPILDALKEEFKGQFDVEFIDVWKNPACEYRVLSHSLG